MGIAYDIENASLAEHSLKRNIVPDAQNVWEFYISPLESAIWLSLGASSWFIGFEKAWHQNGICKKFFPSLNVQPIFTPWI